MYTLPFGRQVLPELRETGARGKARSMSGVSLPPYLIMERGCTLAECARRILLQLCPCLHCIVPRRTPSSNLKVLCSAARAHSAVEAAKQRACMTNLCRPVHKATAQLLHAGGN